MIDGMSKTTIANPIAVTKLLALAKDLNDDNGIGPDDMVMALMCVAIAIVEAAVPDASADIKRAGLHQIIDGVVFRTKQ